MGSGAGTGTGTRSSKPNNPNTAGLIPEIGSPLVCAKIHVRVCLCGCVAVG